MPGLPVTVYSRCQRWGRRDRKVGREDLLKSGRDAGPSVCPISPKMTLRNFAWEGELMHLPAASIVRTYTRLAVGPRS
jgi:hypothetical protein